MKKLVEWTEELSVGIQEIDEQHKVLVDLLNRLYEAIIRQNDNVVIGEILLELYQYTVVHFSVEESLMRIFDYDSYDEHKKHHADLTRQVVELESKFKSGEITISMEVLSFLRSWLTNHILTEDKKYAPILLQKGLKASWSKRSWVGRIWDSVNTH